LTRGLLMEETFRSLDPWRGRLELEAREFGSIPSSQLRRTLQGRSMNRTLAGAPVHSENAWTIIAERPTSATCRVGRGGQIPYGVASVSPAIPHPLPRGLRLHHETIGLVAEEDTEARGFAPIAEMQWSRQEKWNAQSRDCKDLDRDRRRCSRASPNAAWRA